MVIKIANDLIKYTSFVSEFTSTKDNLGDSLQELFCEFPQLIVFLLADDAKEAQRTTFKLNGKYVFELSEVSREVGIEDILEIAQDIPEGEDGVGKILIGAALIAAAFIPGLQGVALFGIKGALSMMVFGMGVSMAIGGAAELIMGQPKLPTFDSGTDTSAVYTFSGIKNTTVSGTPIPIVYGKHRVGGQLVSTYLYVPGVGSYLRAQIGLSEGPLPAEFMNPKSIKVNDISFDDIPKSDKTVQYRRGTKNQIPPVANAYSPVGDSIPVNITPDNFLLGVNTPNAQWEYETSSVCTGLDITITTSGLAYRYNKSVYIKVYLYDYESSTYNYKFTQVMATAANKVIKIEGLTNRIQKVKLEFSTDAPLSSGRAGSLNISVTVDTPITLLKGSSGVETTPEMEMFSEQVTTVDYGNQLISHNNDDSKNHVIDPNLLSGNTYTTTTAVDSVDVILTAPIFYSNNGTSSPKVDVDVYWIEDDGHSEFTADNKVSFSPSLVTKDGKGSKIELEWNTRINLPSTATYKLKVVRVTDKHTTIDIQDDVYVKAINENVIQGQIYPHTALLSLQLKADDLISGGMPTITSEILGVQVPVPVGYVSDPNQGSGVQRYMSGSWNGKLTDDPSLAIAVNATYHDAHSVTVTSTTGLYVGQYVELDYNELRYLITNITGNTVTFRSNDVDAVVSNFAGTTVLRNATRFWTNNPVWCLYDLLTNDRYGLKRYYKLDPAKKPLMLANFYLMAQYCDVYVKDDGTVSTYDDPNARPRFSLDLVMDSAKKASEWVSTICAIMRATPFYSEGLFWLDIDRPKQVTQIFNMSNITNFVQSGNSLKSIPNVLEVQFLNKLNDYKQDSFLLEDSDIAADLTTEERRKTLALYGVTDERQARSLAYYVLKAAKAALTTISFRTGASGLMSSVGSVIGVQHDVPQWGYGGRVVAYDSSTKKLTLSDSMTFSAGHTYAIQIAQNGGAPVTYNVVSQADGTITSVIYLTTNAGLDVATNNYIYVIGDATNVVKPFRITSIKRDADDLVDITAIVYDPSIYTDSDNVSNIGVANSFNFSLLDNVPRSVSNVLAESTIYTDSTGNLKTGVTVYYKPNLSNLNWRGVIVYYGIGGNYTQTEINKTGNVFIPDITVKGNYQFLCVSVFSDSTRQTVNEVLGDLINKPHYNLSVTPFIDNSEFMKGISGLQLVNQGNNTSFEGKSAKFNWRKPITADFGINNVVTDNPIGVTYSTDSWLKEYQITIRNIDGSIRHITKAYDEYYEYKYEQNYTDGYGRPARSFSIGIVAVDRLGRLSKEVTLTVSNPTPVMLA